MDQHAESPKAAMEPRAATGPAPDERLEQAVRAEELAGLRLATRGRAISLLVIAVLLVALNVPAVWYYEALLAVFLAVGFGHYALARSRLWRPWLAYLFVAVDFALLSYTLIVPNPFSPFQIPPQMTWRFGAFIYYFVLVVAVAFSYRPGLMLGAGLAGALGWGAGVAWIASRPETVTEPAAPITTESFMRTALDPRFLDLSVRIQELVVLLLVAGLLALVVLRSRRLVARQAEAARERANLSRYFPPSIVEDLARTDEPLGAVREQPVAVMFADIVGFTQLAEGRPPEWVIELLRGYHARLERAVFDHGGTLDKFLGDGVMATFGTPNAGPRDATNAVACARAVTAAIDAWNGERAERGDPPIRVSIGIHYGPVVLGDVGSERRLEFAVLGDSVNVASRLETLTRDLGCRIAVSDDVVSAVRRQIDDADDLIGEFRDMGRRPLHGRAQDITVWAA